MKKDLFKYKLPLKNGNMRQGLILRCGDGFGEIAPLPGFSKESLDDALNEAVQWIQSGTSPSLPSVRFGIACAQKKLKSVRIPLCALGYKDGFSTVKLKLGHLSLKEAIALTKQHCLHNRLRLDCNRAWNLNQALEFASHFKPSDFDYLEEPVQTFKELIEFSKATHFPIALDESIHSNWAQIPSLTAIVVKPTVVGSIPCVPPPLRLILSSAYESGLGLLHIANLHRGEDPIGLDTYSALADDLLIQPIDCGSGFFSWKSSNPILNMSKLCAL